MSAHTAYETVEPKTQDVNWQGHGSEVTVPSAAVRRIILDGQPQFLGVILLLVSAAFTEVASNIVYIVMVEQAYQLGDGVTAIGIVLIVQAGAQTLENDYVFEANKDHSATRISPSVNRL
jgi:hypothetical protein